jgi:Concanavalin A-like lectin/glucanases superfamily/Domain of unknown function (DUF2341)
MRKPSLRELAGIVFSLSLAAGCTPAESGGGSGGSGGSGTKGGTGGTRTGGSGGSSASGGSSGGSSSSGGSGGSSASGGSSGGSGGSSGGSAGGSGGSSGGSGGSSSPDGGGGSEGPPSSSGSKAKIIKLDTTAAGAAVMGDVAKYPVAIFLNAMNFDFAQAKPKGEDVRFTTMEGAPLPFEIELWDATAKLAALWVKVDVKGNAVQNIKMTYGDPAAASASNGQAVFPKEEGFLGAWHLSEPGSMTADGYKDSSGNQAHATGVNRAPATGDGPVGKSIVLDNAGAMKQWAEIPAAKTMLAPEKMTYSIWLNAKSHNVEYQAMFTKGEGDFRLHYFGKAEYYGNRHLTESCLESSTRNDICPVSRQGADVKPGGGWFHILAIHDHPKTSFWVNGKMEAELNAPEPWKTATAAKVMIGNNSSSTGRAFDGSLDEARLMVVAKDANWIKLEYESQKPGQKFSTVTDAP